MKKSAVAYIFLISLLVLSTPFLAKGDIHGPNECCFLEHDLTDVESGCDRGNIVGAQNPKWCDVDGDGIRDYIDGSPLKWGTCCLLDSVYTVSDWLFIIFIALTLIIFGIAGYIFLFSGGDPQKIVKPKIPYLWRSCDCPCYFIKIIPAIIKAIVA